MLPFTRDLRLIPSARDFRVPPCDSDDSSRDVSCRLLGHHECCGMGLSCKQYQRHVVTKAHRRKAAVAYYYTSKPYCINIDDDAKEYYCQNRAHVALGVEYKNTNGMHRSVPWMKIPLKKQSRTVYLYNDGSSPLYLGLEKFEARYIPILEHWLDELKDYKEITLPIPQLGRYY